MGDQFVFELGVSLLAFVIAFYALTAREHRTPLIVNSVYYAFYIVFGSLALAVLSRAATALSESREEAWAQALAALAPSLETASEIVLALGVLVIFDRVWRLHNQHKNFRTDARLRNIAPARALRFRTRLIGKRIKTYAHDPIGFSPTLLKEIEGSEHLPREQLAEAIRRAKVDPDSAHSMCAAFRVTSFAQADDVATDLARRFLRQSCFVQYASCARHPIEFWARLEADWKDGGEDDAWDTVTRSLVVVDAYTPHFGFTDSIHGQMRLRMEEGGAKVITADPSFAGLHTATMEAFKYTKRTHGGDAAKRQPTLVIYEGAHALVELESIEQYRVFMRHVLPSERLWGGMFTLLIESSISTSDISIIKSYADIFVDQDAAESLAEGKGP